MLVAGDSITAGYSDGSQPVPLGCLNAFPHVARKLIKAKAGADIELDLVAFPGIRLTPPTPEEAEEGAGQGMIDRFFHVWTPTSRIRRDNRRLIRLPAARHLHGLTGLQHWLRNPQSS